MRRYDEAIAAYQKALEFDPHYEDSFYEIGRVHLAQDNRDPAMQIAAKLTSPLNVWLLKEMSLASSPAGVKTSNPQPSPSIPRKRMRNLYR
jgi:tetratricopeptide (TPR) repeat protein